MFGIWTLGITGQIGLLIAGHSLPLWSQMANALIVFSYAAERTYLHHRAAKIEKANRRAMKEWATRLDAYGRTGSRTIVINPDGSHYYE
jgi:hypothetical protein